MKNFLNFIGLGTFSNKSKESDSKQNDIFPKFDYEIEFLHALDKSPTSKLFGLNTYWENRYKELLGNLEPIIEKFISCGYLEISLKEESLTQKQLISLLEKNDLPTSGSKVNLAKRVYAEINDKRYLKDLYSFYKVTSTGKSAIKAYKEKFNFEYLYFLKHQAELFLNKMLEKFETNHFALRKQYPDQRTMGGSFDSFSEVDLKILRHLSEKKAFRMNWSLGENEATKLRAALAVKAAFFFINTDFLMQYLEDCEFLEFSELLEKENVNDPIISKRDVVKLLIEFEYSFLYNHYTLQRLKGILNEEYRKTRITGVQILNDGCQCQKFGIEKFKSKEIDKIPVLPRTARCRCIYNGFREE